MQSCGRRNGRGYLVKRRQQLNLYRGMKISGFPSEMLFCILLASLQQVSGRTLSRIAADGANLSWLPNFLTNDLPLARLVVLDRCEQGCALTLLN